MSNQLKVVKGSRPTSAISTFSLGFVLEGSESVASHFIICCYACDIVFLRFVRDREKKWRAVSFSAKKYATVA